MGEASFLFLYYFAYFQGFKYHLNAHNSQTYKHFQSKLLRELDLHIQFHGHLKINLCKCSSLFHPKSISKNGIAELSKS